MGLNLNNKFSFLLILFILISCDKKEDDNIEEVILSPEIVVYKSDFIDENYLFLIENGGTSSYLINKQGEKLFTWNFDDNLGNDVELLENGQLLGIFKDVNRPFTLGGGSGIIKLFEKNGILKWQYTIADDNFLAHHDVEMLPSGNILVMVWERITVEQAQQAGIITNVDIFPEKLIEINPNNNEIIWEWRSWDRLIQDTDATLLDYGVVSNYPEKIDFNYNINTPGGDIMHANGIDYDAEKDVIHMSVNFYNEIWVIDHSTSSEQAKTNSGGNYNKGGDLIYRYGNPLTYKNTEGKTIFNNNHFPNLLEGSVEGKGNMLVYVNNHGNLTQSIVYELELPDTFNLTPNTNNEPTVVWSFTDSDLFASKFSGAVRLPNGNTLICEGDYGYWEVSKSGDVVWKYNGDSTNFWRGYSYGKNSPAINNLDL
jgi:hypothetical protein